MDYTALNTLFDDSQVFIVISSDLNEKHNRHSVKMRTTTDEQTIDGIAVPGAQLTLYVAATVAMKVGDKITLDPLKWEYTISEFPHPDTEGEVIKLKWLRPKR